MTTPAATQRGLSLSPYLLGIAFLSVGLWGQFIAVNWLTIDLGGGGRELGIINGLLEAPLLLLGPSAGAYLDHTDTRRSLLVALSTLIGLSGILAVTVTLSVASFLLLAAIVVVTGIPWAIIQPARLALLSEIVESQRLEKAMGLHNAIATAARATGPAIAALLLSAVGIASTFWLPIICYSIFLLILLLMRSGGHSTVISNRRGSVRAGLRYIRTRRQLWRPLVLIAVIGMMGLPIVVVMPLLVEEELGGSGSTFGFLVAALGLGSVLGSLTVLLRRSASITRGFPFVVLLGITMLAFIVPGGLVVTITLLLVAGASAAAFVAIAGAALQTASRASMRGRVMGLYATSLTGATALGALLLGAMADSFGTRNTISVAGSVILVVVAISALMARGHGGSMTSLGESTEVKSQGTPAT